MTASIRRLTRSLQPTCYPYDYSTVNEDGKLIRGSSRLGDARTRLNFALPDSAIPVIDAESLQE